jgi:hypothetical protein
MIRTHVRAHGIVPHVAHVARSLAVDRSVISRIYRRLGELGELARAHGGGWTLAGDKKACQIHACPRHCCHSSDPDGDDVHSRGGVMPTSVS